MSKLSEIETQPAAEMVPGIQPVSPPRLSPWISTFWQVVRFCMVGAMNTIIDICILNMLLWLFPTHNATLLLLYNSIAFTLGALNSFGMNKYWTFRRKHRPTGREILFFITVSVLGILCNDALFWMATQLLHTLSTNSFLWVNASKGIAALGTALVSYLGMRLLVFSLHTDKSGRAR